MRAMLVSRSRLRSTTFSASSMESSATRAWRSAMARSTWAWMLSSARPRTSATSVSACFFRSWRSFSFSVVWGYAVPDGTTTARATTTASTALRMSDFLSAGDDEGEDEPEEGEGLGEGDAQEHRRTGHAGRLGLAGHGREGVAH